MASASRRLPDSTSSHVWGLRTERTYVNRGKASLVNIHAGAMEPIITRLAVKPNCKLSLKERKTIGSLTIGS